jgi:GntR family transcriptional regulator, transcriptional repressor for pyruvate dehydrogenase complex
MDDLLAPLRAVSLKEVFVERFERLILSGKLPIGEKLPSERALAVDLGVSRPVVHDGLVELVARGLVSTKPRIGTVINDYRREGSLVLLTSLMSSGVGVEDPLLLRGLLDVRMLMESEAARLAAIERSDDDVEELRDLLAREAMAGAARGPDRVHLNFRFHHRIALASGNPVYAMLLKSLEPAHQTLAGRFFQVADDLGWLLDRHMRLVDAIAESLPDLARDLMQEILENGERVVLAAAAQGEMQ